MFKKSLIVATTTLIIDFLFHFFLTNPMETLTYFVIKFLLAFFVASGMFSLLADKKKEIKISHAFVTGLIFSTLMSTYYRAWELGEAYVPFGSRAPDILGIIRTNLILFSGTWWLGHALFFTLGILLANRLIREKK